MTDLDFNRLLDYGTGVNSLTLEPRGEALDFDEPSLIADVSGQIIQFKLHTIQSRQDFENAFSIDAKVKASYGLFGASAKFSYSESLQYTDEKKYAITTVEVINNTRQIKNIRYKPEAAKLLDNGRFDEFTNRYGDTFVKGITTGGSYYGVFSFSSRDETKLRNIFSDFTGNYAVMVSGNTSITSQMKDKLRQVDLEVSNFQIGGTEVGQPISFDEVIERAKNFPQQVSNENGRPVPKIMSVIDYATLPSPNPPNFIDIQNSKLVIEQYYDKKKDILDMINKINFIRKNPDYYENPDDNQLKQFLKQLYNSLNQITQNASKCVNNVKECTLLPVDIPENINLPKRKQVGRRDPNSVGPTHLVADELDLTHLIKTGSF